MHQHVRLRQQPFQMLELRRLLQVQRRAALAERNFRNDARLVPVRRVDAQHLGAKPRQEARGDRSGQDARQVQDPHPVERTLVRYRPLRFWRRVRFRDVYQRLGSHRATLRMSWPTPLASASPRRSRWRPRSRSRGRVADQPATAAATAGRSATVSRTRSAATRWCGELVWSLIQPSLVR